MNDLRSCCPVSLASFVGNELNQTLSDASELINKWIQEQHNEQKILIQAAKLDNNDNINKNPAKNSAQNGNQVASGDSINQALQLKAAENNVLSAARRMSTTLESLILFIQKVLSAFFPSSQLCQKLACGAQELIVLKAGRVNPSECIFSLKRYLPTDEDILLSEVSGIKSVEEAVKKEEAEDNGQKGDENCDSKTSDEKSEDKTKDSKDGNDEDEKSGDKTDDKSDEKLKENSGDKDGAQENSRDDSEEIKSSKNSDN